MCARLTHYFWGLPYSVGDFVFPLAEIRVLEHSERPMSSQARPMGKASRSSRRTGRRHRHWAVTIYYVGGGKFVRVYTDRRRAEEFAKREKRSPVVRSARVRERVP